MSESLTKEHLAALLDAEGVPSGFCNLFGSHGGEGFVLDHRALRQTGDGWTDTWVVFYAERGEKRPTETFDSEDTASRYLLSKLCPEKPLDRAMIECA